MAKKKAKGLSKGQNHPKARLTDHEVDLVRLMREQGMTYGMLADKFEAGKSTIVDICMYRTR